MTPLETIITIFATALSVIAIGSAVTATSCPLSCYFD